MSRSTGKNKVATLFFAGSFRGRWKGKKRRREKCSVVVWLFWGGGLILVFRLLTLFSVCLFLCLYMYICVKNALLVHFQQYSRQLIIASE